VSVDETLRILLRIPFVFEMTNDQIVHIPTPTHGRVILSESERSPAPLLMGFHGYGERVDDFLDRLGEIPGTAAWHRVSIQALHRFYDRSMNRVVLYSHSHELRVKREAGRTSEWR
jgi:hypothetical protein